MQPPWTTFLKLSVDNFVTFLNNVEIKCGRNDKQGGACREKTVEIKAKKQKKIFPFLPDKKGGGGLGALR